MGNVTATIDENGSRTSYAYTPNGNLASVTDALGNQTSYAYDAIGRLIKAERIGEISDGSEIQTTTYQWDKQGLVIGITDPLGAVETFSYDKNGRMTEKCDRDGCHTAYTYDSRGLITSILYGDGNSVAYSYDALKKLKEIQDSSGITSIITDALGRVISVTDPAGKTVGYEWGSMNEKLRLIYADGKEAAYSYNEKGQLVSLSTPKGTITYGYDPRGRLQEKAFPNGTTTKYSYTGTGMLANICHIGNGFEEEYSYRYDMAGNKIETRRQRQGTGEDSETFRYGYDALNRLTEVSQNGQLLRKYAYDAFGNRTAKEDYSGQTPSRTAYQYNANNQMISLIGEGEEQTYTYDRRGNLTAVNRGEELLKAFTFDAANRMTAAQQIKDGIEKRAEYRYNALGYRIGQDIYSREIGNVDSGKNRKEPQDPKQQIRYILDLTRQYHNLLVSDDSAGDKEQVFYWDGNVAAMEETGQNSYYLQDDLGSPMLLADEEGRIKESYAFDEFGQGLHYLPGDPLQPFGYTGYQIETVGGLYFAQARRYDARAGRFVSEDRIKGNAYVPMSINAYLYCRNQPLKYVDPSGNDCYYFYLPEWEDEAINDQIELSQFYGLDMSEVHLIKITDNAGLTNGWNAMGSVNGITVEIDAVVINTHAAPTALAFGGNSDDEFTINEIQALDEKEMGALILYGCNAGHMDYLTNNIAAEFSRKINGAPTLASDGTVYSHWQNISYAYGSVNDRIFQSETRYSGRDNNGWIIYQATDNIIKVFDSLGKALSTTQMLRGLTDSSKH